MTYELFVLELKRLQGVYGDKSYPSERQRLMWRTFSDTPDQVFTDTVNFLIMSKRSMPLHKDFHDAIREAWQAKKNQEQQALHDRNLIQIMQNAYDPKQYDDPQTRERIKGRIKLLADHTSGKIKRDAFWQGCDFFDSAAGFELEGLYRPRAESK